MNTPTPNPELRTPNSGWRFRGFQKQDLARAAMHDGLILAWDTGLWKTGAIYMWPLLKVGHETADNHTDRTAPLIPSRGSRRVVPKKPVLLVVPGDLHQQTALEAVEKFNIETIPLASQDDFMRLTASAASANRRIPAAFYITSYTQLTLNDVHRIPDAMDCDNPRALMDQWCLKHGDHVPIFDQPSSSSSAWAARPDFATPCEFFAWRALKWADDYSRLNISPQDTVKDLVQGYDREVRAAQAIKDLELKAERQAQLQESFDTLKMLVCARPDPQFRWLAPQQQDFVMRHFLADKFTRYEATVGTVREYGKDDDGKWSRIVRDPNTPHSPLPTPQLKIESIFSPSLADLSHDAFECVCIDEGVRMKGEDTYVGLGVRKMNPKYRLITTATPIKNRLPDIFRLAFWATGGNAEATARWPYRDDSEERAKFAETFMVSERNLTKEAKAAENGGKVASGRYKRLTAEVSNIHRLWKLFGPIVLRRRKDDCGEDIVPKVRRVIRAEMGTLQQKVYKYHLEAEYLDKNGEKAIGAQLQALRMAAAAPASSHLLDQPGHPSEPCPCTLKPVPPEEQLARLMLEREHVAGELTGCDLKAEAKKKKRLDQLADMIAKNAPVFDHQPPRKNCSQCRGEGRLPLPSRSGQAYIPKMASCLTLIEEILARKEQVVVFSAFNDPLDSLSRWLTEADVHHVKLDGRVSQKKRGAHAAKFKRGRHAPPNSELRTPNSEDFGIPVMLAGVECMAEGHSFHLANNVILIAYSWAYDKFIQAINRVHRMNSEKPVNIYVIVCQGTIDVRLESLIHDKNDSAELVLDGRLIGEKSEEINLAELLKIAHKEFDPESKTIDEAIIQAQWPALREKLRLTAQAWQPEEIKAESRKQEIENVPTSTLTNPPTTQTPIMKPRNITPKVTTPQPATHEVKPPALTQSTRTEILAAKAGGATAKLAPAPHPALPTPQSNDWRARLKARVAAIQANTSGKP